jgi:23S rRNA U2552 (ribose-2'-O)-methylase RlmE/FtsJ
MSELLKNFSTLFKSVNEKGESTISESNISFKLEYSENDQIELLNEYEYDKLIQVKNKIDSLEDCKLWDKIKKISNDFELIYLPNKKLKSSSVSKYEPLSRSYFKLWEIIQDFNLINNNSPIKAAGLAEGPGGFIEAMINYRKKFKNICKQDRVYGITLRSCDKDIPGWNKAANFLKKNENVKVHYGLDKTGNIYNIDNITSFAKLFNNDADLVTADGGFDFSTNFNKQEQSSLRIIFCEIVAALSIQKKGGAFVCKVYDTYTHVSISFLFLLSCLYNTVTLTKPFTSRPANSEKYLVCQGFKGISPILLKKLHIIVKSWSLIDSRGEIIYRIMEMDSIPEEFINKVLEYNTNYFNQQVLNIEKTLKYIEKFSLKEDYEYTELYKKTIERQVKLAYYWCKKYKCKINYESEVMINCNIPIQNRRPSTDRDNKNYKKKSIKVI